jgi:flagellar basal body-associated protein FliL
MQNLIYLLPVLGCVAMMGVMMLMMRGNHASHDKAQTQPDGNTHEEIAMLRAEIAVLRAEQGQHADRADQDARP